MQRRTFLKKTSATGLVALVTPYGILPYQPPKMAAVTDPLADSFLNPPHAAKPQTWWHWMNGNVTKEGITLDLEAMQRIGVGGVQNFDAGTGIPKGPLVYLSPEWLEMKRHAIREAERLGLEFTMHNCPGWSSSGGPWITPEMAMQQLTWSETTVSGGQSVSVKLPQPPAKLNYYRDVAVLAFPAIPGDDKKIEPQSKDASPLRLTDWRKKANYAFGGVKSFMPHEGEPAAGSVIALSAVQNLTQRVDKDGQLTWNAPAGNWTILRIGYTPTGSQNRSAPDTGVGLECDKFSKEAITAHFNKMMESLLPTLKPLAQKGKVGLLIDSYEVGMQNWTAGFQQEFQQRNRYDLLPYLPAMTGRIVGGVDLTERFLWDIRRTQADLMSDNYYGRFTELCHQNGLIAYAEPYDRGPMDEMQIGARVDVNMGEFWNGLSALFQNNWTMRRTTRLAASITHINGKKGQRQIVGAEAFTGEPDSARWQEYPFHMKALGDKQFTEGLSRVIFHRYAHQPHPTALPGMTMGPWGIHFDRTNTWWEPAKGWMTYLSRCQSLLQQGLFVADLAYFVGDEGNAYAKVSPDELSPAPPQGYDYDVINGETIRKRATINNGRLQLTDGMSYRVLVLPETKALPLELLRKLRELVGQGLVLVGAKPLRSLGLRGYTNGDAEFTRLVNELWGSINGQTVIENVVGKGRVVWGQALPDVLKSAGAFPDFEVSSRSGDAPITYIHRQINGAEVYFLANQRRTAEDLVVTCRVAGKQPELWDAVTGQLTPVAIFEQEGGRTRLPVSLSPAGSVFIVFRSAAPVRRLQTVLADQTPVLRTKPIAPPVATRPTDVVNTFTISLWAKPEINAMLSVGGFRDDIASSWTDWYAVYPPAGETLFGAGHAACGLAIGRNGVAVWERTKGRPTFVLGAAAPISGWGHVAVVYREGVPSVYVNGKLVQEGKKSTFSVHPGVGPALLSDGASYFNGDMTEPQVSREALSAVQIQQLAATRPALPVTWPTVSVAAVQAKPGLLFWRNGRYTLRDHAGKDTAVAVVGLDKPLLLTESWQVSFPTNTGAPAQITLPKLMSLHLHDHEGVKYFSGTATYRQTFTVSDNSIGGNRRLFLDLGQVEVIAEVRLNGKDLGILWARPYRLDITEAVKAGANQLEVKVTNQWPNRLIGDAQKPDVDQYTVAEGRSPFAALQSGAIQALPDWYKQGKPKPNDGRVTFSTWKHYQANSPLLEAGLIGPVEVRWAEAKAV